MILLITNEFPPVGGGVASYCLGLTKALNSLGKNIAVTAAEKTLHDRTYDAGLPFPVQRVPEHPLSLVRHWARFSAFQSQIHQYQPHLLWGADWRSGIPAALLSRLHRLPYVITAHGSEVLLAMNSRDKRSVALEVYKNSSAIISNSQYTKSLLEAFGLPGHKVAAIPLGVDPTGWEADRETCLQIARKYQLEGKKVILSLGRLTPRKGQDIMLQALPSILTKVPEAVYVIAGKGEDEIRLRSLAQNAGVTGSVRFVGFVPDREKNAYFHLCDVFVQLSRQDHNLVEGFGISPLEAAACGKPSVVGLHGGTPEAVIHEQTGLHVDPLNPEQVGAAVVRLLQDLKLAEELGRKARQRVESEANWENVARKTSAVFDNICQTRPFNAVLER